MNASTASRSEPVNNTSTTMGPEIVANLTEADLTFTPTEADFTSTPDQQPVNASMNPRKHNPRHPKMAPPVASSATRATPWGQSWPCTMAHAIRRVVRLGPPRVVEPDAAALPKEARYLALADRPVVHHQPPESPPESPREAHCHQPDQEYHSMNYLPNASSPPFQIASPFHRTSHWINTTSDQGCFVQTPEDPSAYDLYQQAWDPATRRYLPVGRLGKIEGGAAGDPTT